MEQKYIKGDIVMYKNKIHTITDTVRFNDYNLSDIDYSVDQLELSGVPLTFKILEKNGWKLYKHNIKSYYDDSGINKFYYPIGYECYGSYTSISGASGIRETSIKNSKDFHKFYELCITLIHKIHNY